MISRKDPALQDSPPAAGRLKTAHYLSAATR